MTLFNLSKFSVPASAGNASICATVGQHCGPDKRGRCLRCGEKFLVEAKSDADAEATELGRS